MSGALILITVKVGTVKKVHKEISDLEEIQEAEMLTGPYDVMAIAKADEMTDITDTLMTKVRNIDGVEDTLTNIFIE